VIVQKPNLQQQQWRLSDRLWTCCQQLNITHECSHNGRTPTDPAHRPPARHTVSLESTLSPSSKGLKTTTWIFNKPWTEPTHHHQRQGHDLAYTQVDRPDHPTARTATADPNQILPEKRQKNSAKSARKKASSPTQPTILNLTVTVLPSTNTTLAGVAQSVERVALITVKRSTSRSWVRAPPSAIPIIQAHQSSCSFALLLFGLT
jgi:hypothetical protein